MADKDNIQFAEQATAPPSRGQKTFAAAIAISTIAYLILAITGTIKSANRLTTAEFGVLVVAALTIGAALRRDLFDRLQKFDFGIIKFELSEVKKGQIEVQRNQQAQQALIEDVQLALRLLIKQTDWTHLSKLFKHVPTHDYRVKGELRDEIRHLRAMGLLKMRKGKTVGGMPENAQFDLADYVELTEDGRNFTSHLLNQQNLQGKEGKAAGAASFSP